MALFDLNVMLGPPSSGVENSFAGATDLLREMDRCRIGQALVYSSHARFGHPAEGNQRLLKDLEGHRERLFPCWIGLPAATSEMPKPEELVRQMREHGVKALRLIPGQHLFPVSRRVLGPLLAVMQEHRFPVILDLDRTHWSQLSPWDALFEICEAYPRLPIILLREGGATTRALYPLWADHPNLLLETSYLQSAESLEEICERFGPSRLLFGSGMPQYDPGGAIAAVHGSELTPEQRADIAGNNARRLLGIEAGATCMSADWPVGPGGFRVWDAHAHLGPWHRLHYPVHDAGGTVRRMDQVGVERITVSDMSCIENDSEAGHERLRRAITEYPGRIYGYAVFSPAHHADAPQEFERLLDQPGMVGIKVHCGTHATPAESPRYRRAYEVAHERRLPVLVHGSPAVPFLDKLLRELPGMIWVAAHYAAGPPEGIAPYIALATELPNLVLDATGSGMERGAFDRLLAQMPVQQIVAGSDFPIMDLPYQLGRVLHCRASDAVKQQILWDNSVRLFEK